MYLVLSVEVILSKLSNVLEKFHENSPRNLSSCNMSAR